MKVSFLADIFEVEEEEENKRVEVWDTSFAKGPDISRRIKKGGRGGRGRDHLEGKGREGEKE